MKVVRDMCGNFGEVVFKENGNDVLEKIRKEFNLILGSDVKTVEELIEGGNIYVGKNISMNVLCIEENELYIQIFLDNGDEANSIEEVNKAKEIFEIDFKDFI